MGEKRLAPIDKRKLRNLKQYKDLSDAEFDELMDKKALDLEPLKEFEDRIERKLKQFEDDYELGDMKFNDTEQLRAMAQAMITLEDYEQMLYRLRTEQDVEKNLVTLDKLAKFISDLRSDISKLQDDLRISRKVRKGSGEESAINKLAELTEKARIFYREKMAYVFCPKCDTLLSTVWFQDFEKDAKMKFICYRRLDDGKTCGKQFTISSKELLKMKGSNKLEIMPEAMR
jgi:hypothetical protein